ncbi:MAG: CRISPR-associated endonuclease Cas2 [Candidatus Altiarchaeales archaeon]|nr:MAG: CRISPR-associated endonuclease Cas2 [Candidatus Altiarchaeales archaeon]
MYVIIVYDVSVERVAKVCQFLRRYLNWIQNSVFEGELTKAEFEIVKSGLKERIDEGEDSITIYILPSEKPLKKELLGVKKAEISTVI